MSSPLLAHSLVAAPGAQPTRWVVFLHGILGSGANWRTFARRLVEARPAWGAALVDLREHGASRGLPGEPTVAQAAADVTRLAASLPGPADAIVGHSFGGKVTLSLLATSPRPPAIAWVLDATPGPRPTARGSESTVAVVDMLAAMPRSFASRAEFVERVCAAGHDRPFAQWLAMNLAREGVGERVALALDPANIRRLLDDYFALDLWSVLEFPPGNTHVHVVVGGKSRVFDEADRARLDRAAHASGGRLAAHVLPDAGHWVHVDDPDGLLALVVASM